ncbi:sensor histidine kinase [Streptomyces sp. 3MP-14]|uniref:Oxygen sensor histidine kinase NreB n=1 Tax=Streptomyces mimosae TaxID=2586635 RepID=A0A5N6AHW8_9ACTN|nr:MULTISPECIES: sensor histidine kinase [Streptomyces]KAB8167148.1 sensor histidine kinase [Streptomyces mimosae]KAB8177089.1 sensor histidine kinase [Streptomyces sp. 3MP-14]
MTAAGAEMERRRALYLRWHPCGLLAIALPLVLVAGELTPGTGERVAAAGLVVAAVVLQVWRARAIAAHPEPSAATVGYFAARWALGFALTWLNPFFAFYAAAGYFDAAELLPRRWWRLGMVACSVPVAGSQAGGMPFGSAATWLAFAGLLVANNAMLTIIVHFAEHEEKRSRVQAATIAELERTNAALQQALAENAALHAQLLVQAREAGIADERRRLAAEIHDTIAQGLTGIIAQLRAVAELPDPASAHEHLDRAARLARHSLGEARRSVRDLAPVGLAHDGLPQALRKTVAEWGERTGVRAEFVVTGAAQRLHGEVSATLLRIAQEALANAAKHADASRLGVTLSFMDGEVTLDVRDDGRGFDPSEPAERTATTGFGLDGMRARAERIAGALTVESEPGGGTAVSARVPLVGHER